MHETDICPSENTARLTHPSSALFSNKYNDAIDFDLRSVIATVELRRRSEKGLT